MLICGRDVPEDPGCVSARTIMKASAIGCRVVVGVRGDGGLILPLKENLWFS